MSDAGRPRSWQPPPLRDAAPAAAAPPDTAAIAERARAEGYAAGHAEGLAAGRAKAEATANELAALLQSMATPFRQQESGLLRELSELVVRVATAVVGRELETSSGTVDAVLAEALELLEAVEGPVDVHLHPADAALVREWLADNLPKLAVTLHTDAALLRGGCRVATAESYVDASTERRLDDVVRALRESRGAVGGAES
ncbi:FliH/SctL family protein [Haliea salexigens]|uniref:FliH/SctL family protein n=1 Tax=Haliea salexigens TaxID=287487 RepID=UPI0003F53A4D|nr:FliH/SctL family protein [Haliea salexigens]